MGLVQAVMREDSGGSSVGDGDYGTQDYCYQDDDEDDDEDLMMRGTTSRSGAASGEER
jgi:hypothetical protein